MSTTIHSLAYKITAETAGFSKGVAATRKELSSAKRVMKETQTPIERYQNEVKELDTLLKKGAITQTAYNRKVGQLDDQLATATKATSGFSKSLSTLRGGVTGVASALGPAGVAAGVFAGAIGGAAMKAGRITLDKITKNMEKLDRVGKISAKLSIDPQALRGLQFAAGQLSGMGDEAAATALQRMIRRISEGAIDTGEAKDALKELGLEAKNLNLMGPVDAIRTIADAMKEVKNPADQVRLSFKLFDTEGVGLVNMLRAGSQGIDSLTDKFDRLNGVLTKTDITRIESLNDALQDSGLAVDGMFEQLTAEISVPALAVVKELNKEIERIGGRRNVEEPRFLGTGVATAVQGTTGVVTRTVAGQFGGVGGGAGAAIIDRLLSRIPNITDLIERQHREEIGQGVRNTNAIVDAIRESSGDFENPPGSR